MRSTKFLQTLKRINGARSGKAARGERLMSSLYPHRGTGYGWWGQNMAEQVQHFKNWLYVAVNIICSKVGALSPNIAYVSDHAKPGVTVKASQRGLHSLTGRGFAHGGPKSMSGEVEFSSLASLYPRVGFSDSSSTWLTVGEYRSKALSVVKPHEELEPLEGFHPLRRLLDCPNAQDTAFDLMYESQMFQELCGVSYTWMVPNDYGVPCELWVIPSHWVWPKTGGGRLDVAWMDTDPDKSDDGTRYMHPIRGSEKLISHFEVRPWGGMGPTGALFIPADQIVMERWKNPLDKINGYSSLTAIAQWVDLEESISKSRWAQMINQARPEFMVEMGEGYGDPDDDQISRIEAKFATKLQGEYNYGKPFITPPGTKVTPLSFSPSEMAYKESEADVRDMILSAKGVPKTAAGISENMTFGSILATAGSLCENCLNPRLSMRGQSLSKHLASRWDERAPAWSSLTGNGHGSGETSRRVRLWWDNVVPADPAQVNSDIAADMQCLLPGQELQGQVTGGSKARYTGNAVKISTRSGAVLLCTPNHPILTVKGFVAACELEKGQNLINYTGNRGISSKNDMHNAPTLVEDVFDALCRSFPETCREVTSSSVNFHGDAKRFKSKVNVVGSYSELWNADVSEFKQGRSEDSFVRLGFEATAFSGLSLFNLVGGCHYPTLLACREFSTVLGAELAPSKFSSNLLSSYFSSFCDRQAVPMCLFSGRHFSSLGSFFKKLCSYLWILPNHFSGLRSAPDTHSGVSKFSPEPRHSNVKTFGNVRDRLPTFVSGNASRHVNVGLRKQPLRFGSAANVNIPRLESLFKSVNATPDSGLAAKLRDGFPSQVSLDQIVEIENFHYDGPVFDFESPYGYIVTQNLVVSNCYGITPNELRALRGRAPYKLGGDNPIVQGPGGPMPLPLNVEEGMEDIGALIGQFNQAANADNQGKGDQSVSQELAEGPSEMNQENDKNDAGGGTGEIPSALATEPFDVDPTVEEPNGDPSKRWVMEKDWITLENGTHVFIDGSGNVIAGPDSLQGKPLPERAPTHKVKPYPSEAKPSKISDRQLDKMKVDYSKVKDPTEQKKLKKSVDAYYSGAFQDMNGLLRGTTSGDRFNSADETERLISGMREAFDKVGHKLETDATVHRVVRSMPFDITTPGTVFQDKGFVSTSADKKFAQHNFAGGARTIMNIRLPKGMKVVSRGDDVGAKEVTLPAGCKFRVVSSKKRGSENHIELEVIQ